MSLTERLKKLTRMPGALKVRHLAEVTVTPHVRGQIAEVAAAAQRIDHTAIAAVQRADQVGAEVAALRAAQPVLLNAITSSNGVARAAQRDLTELRNTAERILTRLDGIEQELERIDRLEAQVPRFDALEGQLPRIDRLEQWVAERSDETTKLVELWRADLAPHADSIEFLLARVELVRAEMLNEMRYAGAGHAAGPARIEQKVIDPTQLEADDVRLNLGCGHVPLAGYANVDMRELPGVDVVAGLDDLPVAPASVAEIFSAHVLEHFPRQQLVRHLLPYWFGLLRPGGTFRAIVPDIEAMAKQFSSGETDFETLREVVYGGQEYEGDTHFTGFSPDDLRDTLVAVGYTDVEVVASGRLNGLCLELEVSAQRPGS